MIIQANHHNGKVIMATIVCLLFIFLVSVVIHNILIGLTVSRAEFFIEKSHLNVLQKTALECQRLSHPKLPWGNKSKLKDDVKIRIVLNPKSKPISSYITKKLIDAHASVHGNYLGFSSGILPASVYKKTIFGHWEEKEKYSVPTWVAKNAIGKAII